MPKTIFIIIYTLFMGSALGQTNHLFKIIQNDSVGYINEKGVVVIKPIFLDGNDFVEGLAAVRLNGTYGYIDEAGTFVTPPEYDFASNFFHGLAAAYKNGEPLFINKTGKIILPEVLTAVTFIDSSKGIIKTRSNKEGVINLFTKQLIIDTVFRSISDFTNGVSVVREYLSPIKKQSNARVAIIDSNGKFVVPFGKYENIGPFIDGYATIKVKKERKEDDCNDGVIDTKGNLLFKRLSQDTSFFCGDFHDGLAEIDFNLGTQNAYQGFINLKGEVVFGNANCKSVNNFSNGRAFIKYNNKDNYILVDKNFKRVGNKEFENIQDDTFKNGYAIIGNKDGFGIIDTSGNYVTKSDYSEIDRVGIVNGYFFFTDDGYSDKAQYGIVDLKGDTICKPMLQQFDHNGFVNGLIKTIINDKFCYVNKSGNIVWQQQIDTSVTLKPLNIDFMNRGYFYAYSSPTNTAADQSGGWATSKNKPIKIVDKHFPDRSLSITINTNSIDTFANRFTGMQLSISNTTIDTIQFNAQDSRLYMKLQAQNNKGEWKDIEYLPSSWCGNSYHKIALEPNAFWHFIIPKYVGEFKTKIRAELRYVDSKNKKAERVVYSNIIEGSINPGQFWNKRKYYSSGLMDPYND